MKRLMLMTAVAALSFGAVEAQNVGLKAAAGSVTTDAALFSEGLLGKVPVKLQDGMLKARYFLADDVALRGAISYGLNSKTDTSVVNVESKTNEYAFGLALGAEKHFAGTNRLSPYIGAELGLKAQGGSSKSTNSQSNAVVEVKNPNRLAYSATLLAGADFYVVRHVYLGVEAGWGLTYGTTGATTNTVQVNGNTNTTTTQAAGSSLGFASSMQAGFKVGFVF